MAWRRRNAVSFPNDAQAIRLFVAAFGVCPPVIAEVAGQAFYTGECRFTVEPDDPLAGGFLLR